MVTVVLDPWQVFFIFVLAQFVGGFLNAAGIDFGNFIRFGYKKEKDA